MRCRYEHDPCLVLFLIMFMSCDVAVVHSVPSLFHGAMSHPSIHPVIHSFFQSSVPSSLPYSLVHKSSTHPFIQYKPSVHSHPQALKKYVAVTRHFDDMHEDQFDFHSYCVRKATLRAYVGVLRMEDALYGHPAFARAAAAAVRIYLALADAPTTAQQVRAAVVHTQIHTKFREQSMALAVPWGDGEGLSIVVMNSDPVNHYNCNVF